MRGEQFGIVTDHLGTPAAMFDGTGQQVWGARTDAYGELRDVRGDRHACRFTWPGQYEDEETGLYYNRFRYYDPGGRQLRLRRPAQVFLAGLKHRSYAQDPTVGTDPFGLAAREDMLQQAMDVSKYYEQNIKDVFGEEAQPGIRGSLATGERHSGGAFDPNDFDVDAFVLSRDNPQGWGNQVMPNASEVREWKRPSTPT